MSETARATPGAAISKKLQRLRVPLGFLFAAVFLIVASPRPATLIIGGAIGLAGLLVRAWAAGHIRKNQQLAVSGPYALTRNPLYFGSFLIGLGFTVAAGVWWLAIAFAALFLGIYFPVMRVESEELTEIFGEEYLKYSARVPLFFPWMTTFSAGAEGFDFSLYAGHREYNAALGFVIAWTILALKLYFGIGIWF